MSEHIDQEREAFESTFAGQASFERNDKRPEYYAHLPARQMWDAWQARAAVQPASVVVPDGWTVKTVEPEDGFGFIIQTPRINGVSSGTSVWSESENPAERMLALMLAAAPHPVSGEQVDGDSHAPCKR